MLDAYASSSHVPIGPTSARGSAGGGAGDRSRGGQAQPGAWRCIGEEVSKHLDYEPPRFLRRRLVRRKYVSKVDPDAAPVIAELPAMLQQRSGVGSWPAGANHRQ